jgi:hypothetical protein
VNTPQDPTDLPCTEDPDLFAQTVEIADLKLRNGWHLATIEEARAVCEDQCSFKAWCLATWGDNEGMVGGLTKAERSKFAKTA